MQDIFPLTVPMYLLNLGGKSPDNCLPRTVDTNYHSPPLCFAFHHLKCPSPAPCMVKYYLFLKAQLRYQLLREDCLKQEAFISPLQCPNWIGLREFIALCVLFRSLFNTVVVLMHFAKCVYESSTVTFSYVNFLRILQGPNT